MSDSSIRIKDMCLVNTHSCDDSIWVCCLNFDKHEESKESFARGANKNLSCMYTINHFPERVVSQMNTEYS